MLYLPVVMHGSCFPTSVWGQRWYIIYCDTSFRIIGQASARLPAELMTLASVSAGGIKERWVLNQCHSSVDHSDDEFTITPESAYQICDHMNQNRFWMLRDGFASDLVLTPHKLMYVLWFWDAHYRTCDEDCVKNQCSFLPPKYSGLERKCAVLQRDKWDKWDEGLGRQRCPPGRPDKYWPVAWFCYRSRRAPGGRGKRLCICRDRGCFCPSLKNNQNRAPFCSFRVFMFLRRQLQYKMWTVFTSHDSWFLVWRLKGSNWLVDMNKLN